MNGSTVGPRAPPGHPPDAPRAFADLIRFNADPVELSHFGKDHFAAVSREQGRRGPSVSGCHRFQTKTVGMAGSPCDNFKPSHGTLTSASRSRARPCSRVGTSTTSPDLISGMGSTRSKSALVGGEAA